MTEKKVKDVAEYLEQGQLNELREIITGMDKASLDRLHKLMKDPHEFAIEISDLLPFSIRKLIEKGSIHSSDLLPFFEEIIQESIQNNPQRLANILFPIMGPAIRKAVAEDIKKMLESLNQGLESGLSPSHIKWRFQALFSGKNYTEIMLSHAYVYHVKHLFLIHKESALLLHQIRDPQIPSIEADMVASMLSAISDFVKDSFQKANNESVETIKIGETNLWIEQGPLAIIAAVVDGNPPPSLRLDMQEAIEAVHYNHRNDLEKFDGNTAIFEHTEKFLKNCLQSEKKQKKAKPPFFALFLLLIVLGAAGYFGYQHIQAKSIRNQLISAFQNEPGYLISQTRWKNNQLTIQGARDELSKPAAALISESVINPDQVTVNFQSFISVDSVFVIRRANKVLNPPPTIRLSFKEGVLTISGKADASWITMTTQAYHKIWGVTALNWQLEEQQKPDLGWIISDIESYSFTFEFNDIIMTAKQKAEFDSLTTTALLLDDFNHEQNQKYILQIQSFTSNTGNITANRRVALSRAESFLGRLDEAGVPRELMETAVIFNEETDNPGPLRGVRLRALKKKE
ncbi:MAG: hypothetical protein PF694_09420 [Bacteroidetes bacterium]|jgi:hypothetical protein|nr:hypothetical protein [Bacteroidota bacterium]